MPRGGRRAGAGRRGMGPEWHATRCLEKALEFIDALPPERIVALAAEHPVWRGVAQAIVPAVLPKHLFAESRHIQ